LRAAAGAFSLENQQVADERDIFQCRYPMAAGRAARTGFGQRQGLVIRYGRFSPEFGALSLPFALHHLRQSVNHHVEEAADTQAEQPGHNGQACQ